MRPRDRIKTIREIVAALEGNDWNDIDLVLSQHGFPVADEWRGNEKTYVQAMIERGQADRLRELHSFLYSEEGLQEPGSALEEITHIWKPGLYPGDLFFRLFISHTHRHRTEVASLKAALSAYGILGFVAHQDIEPAKEWEAVIESALGTCDAGIAYLTEDFPESKWTDQEVGFCLGRHVPVIPVKIDIDPYGLLGKVQAVPARKRDAHDVAFDLFEILRKHERTRQRMAEVSVDHFAHSNTFNQARTNLARIKKISPELWTSGMVERVRTAAKENDQLYKADVDWGRSTVAADALELARSAEERSAAA